MKYLKVSLTGLLILLISCSDDQEKAGTFSTIAIKETIVPAATWTIDQSQIIDAGPGLDGIPSLVNPETIMVEDVTYLEEDDLIIGVSNGTNQLAIPHRILDWHEIVNLDSFGSSTAIVYCPLTGTGIGWDTFINNEVTTFGVSGLLFKNNIIPYDRATNSFWSQLTGECVNGQLTGDVPKTRVVLELPWSLWKIIYPDSRVVSTNTGHSRQYAVYPYGSYKTDNDRFIFPIPPLQNNIPSKERVYVINSGDKAKVYRFEDFGNGKIIKDQFEGEDYLLVGNPEFIISFKLDAVNVNNEFEYAFDNGEIVMTDDKNNQWSIFGQSLAGPNRTQFLDTSHSGMMSYYFSVESFYPNPEFYN